MAETSSDGELATRAGAGDGAAFTELYDRYFQRVYDYLARMTRNRDDAADLTQDTFLRAMNNLGQLRDPDRFRSWLFAIARSQALNGMEKRKRSVPVSPTPETDAISNPVLAAVAEDPSADPELVAAHNEMSELVWEAAESLDERTYTVFDLTVRHGMDSAEIAEVMGVSAGAGYTMVSRMKTRVGDSIGTYLLMRKGSRDCEELAEIVAAAEIPPVSRSDRRTVDRHVRDCDICESTKKAMVAPSKVFGAFAMVAAPAGLQAQIRRRLESDWTPPPPPTGGGPSRGRRLALAVAAAAVVIVLSVLTGLWLWNDSSLETDSVSATAESEATPLPSATPSATGTATATATPSESPTPDTSPTATETPTSEATETADPDADATDESAAPSQPQADQGDPPAPPVVAPPPQSPPQPAPQPAAPTPTDSATPQSTPSATPGDPTATPTPEPPPPPPPPPPPTISLVQPAPGTTAVGTRVENPPPVWYATLSFLASVSSEDFDNSALTVRWQSDVDGLLGTGIALLAELSAPCANSGGTSHLITATVRDPNGQQTSTSVSVTIYPDFCPAP